MYKITFKGTDNETMGLSTIYIGRRKRAKEKIITHPIPFSDKDEIEHTGKYEPYERSMEFHVADKDKVKNVNEWLTGYGKLVTDLDVGGYFKAHVISELDYQKLYQVEDKMSVDFLISPPFFYLDSGDIMVTKTVTPATITNVGTIPSEPYLKITGSGNITLDINGSIIQLTGVVDHIVIDTEAGYAYNGTTNEGEKMVGDFPVFQVGVNNIAWTGTVTKIEIIPRWRER